jgi:hypothetical protein
MPQGLFYAGRVLGLLALALLAACQSDTTGPKTPEPGVGAARFGRLLHNPKWYRTYDSTSSLLPDGGAYIFSWTFLDTLRHPDSFYVGIDTLWMLPQNANGDTSNDWDLMVCPGGQCAGGVHSGFFGVNYSEHFGPGASRRWIPFPSGAPARRIPRMEFSGACSSSGPAAEAARRIRCSGLAPGRWNGTRISLRR